MSYNYQSAWIGLGGETDDALRLISTPIIPTILDSTLNTLTHRSLLIRRSFYFFILFLFYTLAALTFAIPSSIRSFPSTSSSSSLATSVSSDDFSASSFVPTPPTPEQNQRYEKLLNVIESRSSAFSPSNFSARSLSLDSTKVVGVTAVVLNWKRKRGLQLVLKHISRYPFIREIIVWNNRGGDELVSEDFVLSTIANSNLRPPTLRIYNSPSNIHDMGKHIACSLASYKHCYFNDDDWLNIYLDSLYTQYLECCAGGGGPGRGGSGGRIVSNTMPIIHLEHRRWRFHNPDIDLHAGFTWLGTGSFSPRHLSVRFLNQQSALPDHALLRTDQVLVSDMFFSLWTNSYPEQFSNDLIPIDVEGGEVGWSRGSGVDQWKVVYGNIQDAITKLYDILLLEDTSLVPDPFPLAVPPPESHTRAPCGNDGCLFTTSLTPFPPPEALFFSSPSSTTTPKSSWFSFFGLGGAAKRGKKIINNNNGELEVEGKFDPHVMGSVQEYEYLWDEIGEGWPEDNWWIEKGSWHLAVDGRGTDTCWESWRPPEQWDYFGLTLVKPRVVKIIKVTGSPDLENIVAWENIMNAGSEAWELLSVKEDGSGGWEARRVAEMPKVKPISPTLIELTLVLEPLLDYDGVNIPIRKFKFVSRGRKRWKLAVCGFEVDGWDV